MAKQKIINGENVGIAWTDYTLNLWHGCTKVHEGCNNCYAEVLSNRFKNDVWGNDKKRNIIKSAFVKLNDMQAFANKANIVSKVFVGSMMDIFEKDMPTNNGITTNVPRQEFLTNVKNGAYNNLFFLCLTKRPSNINKLLPMDFQAQNIMFGTSISMQKHVNLKDQLLKVNGKRFLSVEPQLEKIDLGDLTGIDWVIQGGESGHHKRPFNIDWAYSMKEQCEKQNVAYFFKQIDKIQSIPGNLNIKQFPKFLIS